MIADTVSAGLDKAAALSPGRGRLDIGLATRGSLDGGWAGGFADYSHHLNKGWSAFGRGEAGYDFSDGFSWAAVAGLRGRW